MTNSSALPFPIPSGGEDVVPLDEGIRDCDVLPVNRTMKKYKIYVTNNLNFLL